MGTRADFYVGRGKDSEWLGSIAWDGYPDDSDVSVLFIAASEQGWRDAVASFIEGREDGTRPDQGWPWPWEDSRTTDYSYAFDEGGVWFSSFGHRWWNSSQVKEAMEDESDCGDADKVEFPDMSERTVLAMGTKRDSIMLIVG